MSTSLVYHAFNAVTYEYVSTKRREGAFYFHLRKKPQYRRCAACGSRDVVLNGRAPTTVRTLPIGFRPVFLVLELHVLACRACGARRQESRDVAEPRRTYTRAFAKLAVDLASLMPISAVAGFLKCGWGIVKTVLKENLQRRARRRKWSNVRRVAIDEFAVRKGQNYMTVVVDLDSGQVLYTAEGRDHTVLKPFFRRLRRGRGRLKAIAVDMSSSYLKAIKEYAPDDVVIVHDRYHVVALMNEALDRVRRDEHARMGAAGKPVLKGTRYLLLTGRERIEDNPDKQSRLDALLSVNTLLHKAYLLKEDLRLFWRQDSKADARDFITRWSDEARQLKNRHLTRMASTIERCLERILAWYDYRITTGPLEGINNKIKVLKRMAYGYRDIEFFRLRLLFIHETTFRLSGA